MWALDTTYIPLARGFVYLTAVLDVASRKVLARKVAITLEACHAAAIIEQAFTRSMGGADADVWVHPNSDVWLNYQQHCQDGLPMPIALCVENLQ